MLAHSSKYCSPGPRRSLVRRNLLEQQLGEFEVLTAEETGPLDRRTVRCLDYSLVDDDDDDSDKGNSMPLIPYNDGWDLQKDLLEAHLRRLQEDEENAQEPTTNRQFDFTSDGSDVVVMLQHEPVYTLGTASDESFILQSKVPVVRMDRGGEVTFHGPGQLTVYPILDLRGYRQDIHWYMRALEESILKALHSLGLKEATREDGITGVWIRKHKVAAVGIKCRRWITMHGLAVNVEETSLEHFDGIVACGLDGRNVGCLNQFLEEAITVNEFATVLRKSMEEVFCIDLRVIDSEM